MHMESMSHTWGTSLPLRRWALYSSGLAIKAMPGKRAMSCSPDLCLMCSAEKLPSMINVQRSSFFVYHKLEVSFDPHVMTYGLYLTFQSSGRFIPGCGQAGQNIAITPSVAECSGWILSPCSILFLRSLHWQEACSSCLYIFCRSQSVPTCEWMLIWYTGTRCGNILFVVLCNLE